jgi:anti-sigma factor RsiW
MMMIAEETEFQISQYHDGTLSPAARSAVDELLKSDPAARKVLEDFQKLDSRLANLRIAPPVQWDRYATRISIALNEENTPEQNTPEENTPAEDTPATAGRIGFAAWSGRLRIAAAVLIVATVGVILRHGNHASPLPRTSVVNPVTPRGDKVDLAAVVPGSPAGLADVRGPAAEAPNGPAREDVSFGPSPLAAAEGTSRYADRLIVPGQSKVVISEAIGPKIKEKSRPH